MTETVTGQWQDFVVYGESGPDPQTMIENELVRVIIAGVKAGQRIPIHPEAAAVYHILEGQGTMTVDGQAIFVRVGTVIAVGQGAQRGLQAETQLVFMAVRVA